MTVCNKTPFLGKLFHLASHVHHTTVIEWCNRRGWVELLGVPRFSSPLGWPWACFGWIVSVFNGDIADVMASWMRYWACFVKMPLYVTPSTNMLFLPLLYHLGFIKGILINFVLGFIRFQKLVVIDDIWVEARKIQMLVLMNSVKPQSEVSILIHLIHLPRYPWLSSPCD